MAALNGNYKFQSLKVFGSTENLFKNVKKYRKVFDTSESCYIYAEVAFYNKLFDEEEWRAEVKLICKNTATGEQVCELKKELYAGIDQNILYVREGWGTPDPGWWKKGAYKWEAYIDGKFLAETNFYINDRGLLTPGGENTYFDIRYVKLFESPRNGQVLTDRVYLKTFGKEKTRYINIEMELDLKNPDENSFPLEFQFNFYNDSGQHKAYMEYFNNVTDQRKILNFDTGYGSESGGYWYADHYTLEVLFMDTLVAIVPFTVGESDEEQLGDFPFSVRGRGVALEAENLQTSSLPGKPTFEQATEALNGLIGLPVVKREVEQFATYLQFLKYRKEQGIEGDSRFNLHAIFTGNPGTGKTTVARMLGQIYHSLDLLSKPDVHEVGRVDLVGEYIGQTAPKVKKAIDKARGGILFIDEAYSLSDRGDDGKDFGREVIEVLIKEMSDGPGDLAVIFAGYPKEMQNFVNTNPGLASRISKIIHFPDYAPDELMKIAEYTAGKVGVMFAPDAQELLHKKVVEMYRNRNERFGNARYINGLVEEAKQHLGLRLMKEKSGKLSDTPKETLSTITLNDVEETFGMDLTAKVQLPIDEALLTDSLAQLNELTGLANVKKDVNEMVKLVRYYKEIGKDVKKSFSIHTVFTGNPGTGKTTVARIIVSIYKALGILERGHLVETDRKGLVAGFIGQTAIKTGELIDKAMGGGLFIDEAYGLTSGGGTDFGREAIETLLKRMEDSRGEFMTIVAGYPKEMRTFLEANPGLMSRFDKTLHFEDYTVEELLSIAEGMLDKENLHLNETAKEHLQVYLKQMLDNRHQYFGNARTVRKVVAEAIRRQNLRMASTPNEARGIDMIKTVTLDDLTDLQLLEQTEDTRPRIGFGGGQK